jgi:hypothetical protein
VIVHGQVAERAGATVGEWVNERLVRVPELSGTHDGEQMAIQSVDQPADPASRGVCFRHVRSLLLDRVPFNGGEEYYLQGTLPHDPKRRSWF